MQLFKLKVKLSRRLLKNRTVFCHVDYMEKQNKDEGHDILRSITFKSLFIITCKKQMLT